jgi:hypothetical protein
VLSNCWTSQDDVIGSDRRLNTNWLTQLMECIGSCVQMFQLLPWLDQGFTPFLRIHTALPPWYLSFSLRLAFLTVAKYLQQFQTSHQRFSTCEQMPWTWFWLELLISCGTPYSIPVTREMGLESIYEARGHVSSPYWWLLCIIGEQWIIAGEAN